MIVSSCCCSNGQLSAVCNALGLNGWGTKAMLMKRLQQSVEQILRDDQLIRREGLAQLSVDELYAPLLFPSALLSVVYSLSLSVGDALSVSSGKFLHLHSFFSLSSLTLSLLL